MAESNFPRCLARILRYEGKFTRNPKDPGNWTGGRVGKGVLKGTNFGIAANSYPNIDIAHLTVETAGEIYRRDYWNKVNGDLLPVGVDLAVFDPAVNAGVSRARKWYSAAKGAGSDKAVVQAICANRRAFYRGLRTFATFGKGWLSRVADVEATAVSWILAASGKPAVQAKAELKAEAAKAKTDGGEATAKAVAGTTGSGTVGLLSPSEAQPDSALSVIPHNLLPYAVAAVVVALVVAALIYAHHARAHSERARAYKEAADAHE
jgi:lysozyme family protein